MLFHCPAQCSPEMLSVVVTDVSTTWVEIIIRVLMMTFFSDCWKVSHLTLMIISTQVVERLKGQSLDSDNDFCSDCPKVSHLTLMMTSRKHHFSYCLSISNLNRSQNQERTKQKIFLKYTGKHLGNSTLLLRTSDRTSSLQNSVSSSINNFF